MSTGFVSSDPLDNLTNVYQRPIFINANRVPTTNDLQPPGTQWKYLNTIYESNGTGGWTSISGDGALNTINNLTPTSGNITIAGTANQITVANAGSTVTLSLPSAISGLTSITSGSFITSSATLGTTFTANSLTPTGSDSNIDLLVNGKGTGGVIHSRGLVGGDITIECTNTDNTNSASRAGIEIAVGGSSAGDPYLTFLVSGNTAFTMGLDNSVSDNFVISSTTTLGTNNVFNLTAAGAASVTTSLTAGTSITATLGDVTATNGNLVASTAGKGVVIKGGTGGRTGTVTLASGTVTLSGLAFLTANSRLVYSNTGPSGTPGILRATINVGAGTVVFDSDSGTDNSVLTYVIFEQS